jgi:hypothetical protein
MDAAAPCDPFHRGHIMGFIAVLGRVAICRPGSFLSRA